MSLKRPAAGGESCKQDSFFGKTTVRVVRIVGAANEIKQKHYENVTNKFAPKSARLDITFLGTGGGKSDYLWKRHKSLRLYVRNDGR